jgi:hypothetical protein
MLTGPGQHSMGARRQFRLHQWLLIGGLLPTCWLWMMGVHELGHVAGAWSSGGNVERVVWHPLAISRTDVAPNPRPLVVVWAGPMVGALAPLAAWLIARLARLRIEYLLRFFAGFCLVANGAYIAGGAFGGVGDAGDMLRCGSPLWTLWAFGLVALPLGLALWNGQGPRFGLGSGDGCVDHRHAYACLVLLLLTVGVTSLLDR